LDKKSEGRILKLFDTYEPTFYVLPKGAEIFQKLSNENSVRRAEWVNKFTDLFDRQIKKLICIYPEPVFYHETVRRLEKDPRVAKLYNTNLSHLQNYLFKLRIEPTSKVEVEYDDKSHLRKIKKLDDKDILAPPPFSILHFEIEPSLDSEDVILEIRARKEDEEEILFEGEEEGSILKQFCDYVQKEDPDILISTDKLLDHLFARMGIYGLDLGRESSTQGRVSLDSDSFHLPALIERARFGFLPLGLAARYGMNRSIDSRNCYELIQRGFVIPSSKNQRYDSIRTVEEIVAKDKGGMIFSPQVGLHENVVVLDYENEYANLILRHNLSYETEGHEKGLLPLVLERVLNRRIFFKNLQKSFPVNSNEWIFCEQRIDTLKNILVSLYGTSGSFWNRFANVKTFEEINRLSREILIKSKDIVQEMDLNYCMPTLILCS
jgi:DNA polymerase elongation subunit (family B)